jgi:hypothetical protein
MVHCKQIKTLYNKKKQKLSIDKKSNGKTCRFVNFVKHKLLMASMFSGAKHGRKNPKESREIKILDLAMCQHHINLLK